MEKTEKTGWMVKMQRLANTELMEQTGSMEEGGVTGIKAFRVDLDKISLRIT